MIFGYTPLMIMWKGHEKFNFLNEHQHIGDYRNVPNPIRTTIDNRHTWLTEGLHPEFDTFYPYRN